MTLSGPRSRSSIEDARRPARRGPAPGVPLAGRRHGRADRRRASRAAARQRSAERTSGRQRRRRGRRRPAREPHAGAIARAAAAGLDRGLAGRAARAGRRARARRSAAPGATARAAGRRGRSPARSASTGRRTGPPARTHSTISPPAASTAGIIASSEPPVVRMSSTRSTFSPGLIVKPRRNSRRGAPPSDGDLLREDRPGAQLAAGLEREDHAARRRPGDEVHGRRPVLVACAAPAQNAHSSLVAAGSWSTWNFSR